MDTDLIKELNQKEGLVTFDGCSIQKSQIEVDIPGITIQKFKELCTCTINLDFEGETDDDLKICLQIQKICNTLMKFNPQTLEELLLLYKCSCGIFLTERRLDKNTLIEKVNLLHKTFNINVANWDLNPVMLHLMCKTLSEVLEGNVKHMIFFAKKIDYISTTSFYISVCLIWSALFQLLEIKNKNMFRFYKFSTLIEELEKIDLHEESLKQFNRNKFYMILEIVSFLQNAMVLKKNTTTPYSYSIFFQYTNDDLLILEKWCETVKKAFELKLNIPNTDDYSLISELLEFDIMYVLKNNLPQKKTDVFDPNCFVDYG